MTPSTRLKLSGFSGTLKHSWSMRWIWCIAYTAQTTVLINHRQVTIKWDIHCVFVGGWGEWRLLWEDPLNTAEGDSQGCVSCRLEGLYCDIFFVIVFLCILLIGETSTPGFQASSPRSSLDGCANVTFSWSNRLSNDEGLTHTGGQ